MSLLNYEPRTRPLLSRAAFTRRLLGHGGAAAAIIGLALLLGMVGYHWTERLPWIDAFLNAAMILSGMGPQSEMHTDVGKLFAGCYALFSGVVFLVVVGVMFAPVAHRLMHKLHIVEG
jgi:hypothetical protein